MLRDATDGTSTPLDRRAEGPDGVQSPGPSAVFPLDASARVRAPRSAGAAWSERRRRAAQQRLLEAAWLVSGSPSARREPTAEVQSDTVPVPSVQNSWSVVFSATFFPWYSSVSWS